MKPCMLTFSHSVLLCFTSLFCIHTQLVHHTEGELMIPRNYVVPVNSTDFPQETWGLKLGLCVGVCVSVSVSVSVCMCCVVLHMLDC